MTESTRPGDTEWGSLVRASSIDRRFSMAVRFRHLAALDPLERDAQIDAMLATEASLEAADLRAFSGDRLLALTQIDETAATTVLEAMTAAERRLTGTGGMSRTVALQGACRDLSLEEIAQVERVFPAVRTLAGLPPVERRDAPESAPVPLPAPARAGGRSWLSRLFSRS